MRARALYGLGAALGFLACTAGAIGAPAQPGAAFYVAPNGSDVNPGTQAQPFATLERARDAVRQQKAKGALPAGGVTVFLRGGVYSRSRTFTLEKQDSGTASAPVTYRAFPGETVRLSGGKTLPASAFKPVSDAGVLARLPEEARGKVLQADVSAAGLPRFDEKQEPSTALEVFFNDKALKLARWPNADYVKIARIVEPGTAYRFYAPDITPARKEYTPPEKRDNPYKAGVFEYTGDRPARWTAARDAWMFGYWALDWADECVRLARVDTEKKQIHADRAHGYGYKQGQRYYVYNLLEEVDAPGEWYLDRRSATLYLYPPAPMAGATVELSPMEAPLVSLDGASHVTLHGITLEATRGTAVTISGGAQNLIAGCTIRKTAGKAVSIDGGTGNGVRSCDIYDTNGGISLSGGDRASLTPAGHFAENNHIHNYARIKRTYNPAIHLNGVGNRAAHNLIHDAPHMAIGFSGNEHVMEFNELFDVCQETSDSGVFYCGRDWTQRGHIIRHNFIHDIIGIGGIGAFGVYLDDQFSSATVTGNVFFNMRNNAFHIGGGRDNIVTDNILVKTGPIAIDARGLGWAATGQNTHMERLRAVPYQSELWRKRYPQLANILEDEPSMPKRNVVQRNVFWETPDPHLAKQVREHGTVADNWRATDDPGFVNAGTMDFRLRADAAVYRNVPGFQKIPFEQIGLFADEYRPQVPPAAPCIAPASTRFLGDLTVTMATRTPGAVIRYTLDGTEPTPASPAYTKPIQLTQTATVRAAAFSADAKAPARSAIAIATYTGGRFVPGKGIFVSELPALECVSHGGLKLDTNYRTDGPLSLGGQRFEKGILLHPKADAGGQAFVTYALGGGLAKAQRFKARIGVEDAAGKNGSVTFAVDVRRGGQWQRVFESGVFRGGQTGAESEVDVDISGADQLRLGVTDAKNGASSDHAAWGGARLE